jgi:hypothetical protein
MQLTAATTTIMRLNDEPEQLRRESVRKFERMKFESECISWNNSIKSNAGKQFFNNIQFITKKEQEAFGSRWQQVVCYEIGVPEEQQKEFWLDMKGKATARATLNRRRMNATMGMKKKFQGRGNLSGLQSWLPAGCCC